MTTRSPWAARWGIFSRPTIGRYAIPTLGGTTNGEVTVDSQTTRNSGISMTTSAPSIGQSFTIAKGKVIDRAVFKLSDAGTTPDGTLVSRIYENDGTLATPTVGTLLSTSTAVEASGLTSS